MPMTHLNIEVDEDVFFAFTKAASNAALTQPKFVELLLFCHAIGNPFGEALFGALRRNSDLIRRTAAVATGGDVYELQIHLVQAALKLRPEVEELWRVGRGLEAGALVDSFCIDFLSSVCKAKKLPRAVEVEVRHERPTVPPVTEDRRAGRKSKASLTN
jgi:hypothetical protein